MTLNSPVGGRHRYLLHCYNAKGEFTTRASATPNYHRFEVAEGVTRVIYTMQDGGGKQLGQWIWNGEAWLSLELPEGITCLEETIAMRKIKKAATKVALKAVASAKVSRKKKPVLVDGIDAAVWEDAVEYTEKYNERFDSVKQAFGKVTK